MTKNQPKGRELTLIGIYNANGGLIGELSYLFGKILGTWNCSLCALSHELIREKSHFRDWRHNLPVPFELLHLNEVDEVISRMINGRAPCVIWIENSEIIYVLTDEELCQMDGDEALLMSAVNEWLSARSYKGKPTWSTLTINTSHFYNAGWAFMVTLNLS